MPVVIGRNGELLHSELMTKLSGPQHHCAGVHGNVININLLGIKHQRERSVKQAKLFSYPTKHQICYMMSQFLYSSTQVVMAR